MGLEMAWVVGEIVQTICVKVRNRFLVKCKEAVEQLFEMMTIFN